MTHCDNLPSNIGETTKPPQTLKDAATLCHVTSLLHRELRKSLPQWEPYVYIVTQDVYGFYDPMLCVNLNRGPTVWYNRTPLSSVYKLQDTVIVADIIARFKERIEEEVNG